MTDFPGPQSPDPRSRDEESRRRQRARAIIMALLLGAFVVLVYAITIAKMGMLR